MKFSSEWQIKEQHVTPQSVYQNRRAFLKQLGLWSIASSATKLVSCSSSQITQENTVQLAPQTPLDTIPTLAPRTGFPAARNLEFEVPERALTDRLTASSYNNYYEFTGGSKKVWDLTTKFNPFPWTIQIKGLVEKAFTLDIEKFLREVSLEERILRFRCVEAWAMTVPWTGFPLKKLIEKCKPLSKATHIQFISASRPSEIPGIAAQPWYPFPYYEGLRMDEAINELAFVATGMYGEPLTKQNGSPLRLVLPWKYGYKSAKAIDQIIFMDEQPKTFWNDLQPLEYSFTSNVNPAVPHPRWSQATERLIPDGELVPTMRFNGYEKWVGNLYPTE